MDRDLTYYDINKLLWRWSRKDGARIVQASLSMEQAPPELPNLPAPKLPPAPRPDPAVKMANDIVRAMDAFSRFKTWLGTPDPPKPPKAPPARNDYMAIPPFDIQQIPDAMRKESMPLAARLMEHWFNGKLNAHGVETGIVKLDGVLKFAHANESYEYLVNTAIRSPEAHGVLAEMLFPYRNTSQKSCQPIYAAIPSELHKRFCQLRKFIGVQCR